MPNRPTEPDVPERAYGRLNTRIDPSRIARFDARLARFDAREEVRAFISLIEPGRVWPKSSD